LVESDSALHSFVKVMLTGDTERFSRLLSESPNLARASFQAGATRQSAKTFFLEQIARYIYAGDTALHIAAAAYQAKIVTKLLAAGADVSRSSLTMEVTQLIYVRHRRVCQQVCQRLR